VDLGRAVPTAIAIVIIAAIAWPIRPAPSLAAPDPAIERGRAYAERSCSLCHAIGRTGASPYAPAPPFRSLHERYPVEDLAEALAEGISVSHRGPRQMPEFTLSAPMIDDFLAYLKSLE
jgi:mono/diheme cytochrome c family protein